MPLTDRILLITVLVVNVLIETYRINRLSVIQIRYLMRLDYFWIGKNCNRIRHKGLWNVLRSYGDSDRRNVPILSQFEPQMAYPGHGGIRLFKKFRHTNIFGFFTS